MKKDIAGAIIIPILILIMGCHKKPTPVPAPGQATLTSPAQDAVCTTGTILSVTQSAVTFTWDASDHTDGYNLVIKNLLTSDSTTQTTTETQATVTLMRNTPYAWYIVSTATKTSKITQSLVWKFYNSGPGVVTYAPFPATITSPTFAQLVSAASGTVNLTWTGSVVAPDVIASYDVYFGTSATPPPTATASAITNSFLNNVQIVANTIYYWRVVTRDTAGNTSDSGVYQFSTD